MLSEDSVPAPVSGTQYHREAQVHLFSCERRHGGGGRRGVMDSAVIQPSETDEAEIKDVSYLIKCHLLYLLTLVWFPKRCAEIMEMFLLLFHLFFFFACLEQSFTKKKKVILNGSLVEWNCFIFVIADAAFQQAGVSVSLHCRSGRTEALKVFLLRP